MKVVAISTRHGLPAQHLLEAHHRLRAQVFSNRLGWEVGVLDGREADVFDALQPTYILAVSDSARVAGCARLLPAMGPTMVTHVFSSLLTHRHLNAHPSMIESSRFCVDTTLVDLRGGGLVHEATLTMFAGIIEWCIANGYTELVTVTDLRFERILARVGWHLSRLGEPKNIGKTIAVAGTLPVNAETFLRLRPSSYRSEFISPDGQRKRRNP
ncbi:MULTISPECIES: acyl-homoserine-lactone synthase TraI [Rhizobium]|uniref:acyl-homoserine-lactone synthase n=1 Tax=Rhizobium TaxID=379 RepID=UPI0007EE57FD|nr:MULTISPECIES: acyl-homoserine-lactone synthase TraI [Rhizobium]MBB6305385.1 acyl homoserine lactone synthase [Rhizobium leucaenae]MDK4743148.1 acyl-homoserine-lactone synthase TraI [Rhizobium sp. CNPSo 3464]